jgi:hypothetical protein
MLRSRFILASLGFAALSLAACSGTVNSNTGGAGGGSTGGTGGGGNTSEGPGVEPAKPDESAPQANSGLKPTLAIRKLFIGDTDRMGSPSSSAWKDFGYDLDGKISTSDSKDLCMPADGAKPSAVYEDGEEGRDNSFGKNILPIVTALAMDASTQINDSIETGSFTIMIRLDELGTAAAENGVLSKLYGGAQLVDAMGMDLLPAWDGTDMWPVVNELLVNGDIENPQVQFKGSYVVTDPATNARTWVSGDFGNITLNLAIAGFTLGLTVNHAVITMELNDDNSQATNGTIAGILNTEQLISELAKVAGSFDPSLCPPSSTFESIAQQIRQASDIGADGSQDPSKECDGISMGLGFNMQKVELGAVSAPAETPPDPCMPM